MRHARCLPRRRNAFTLIELLVVLVLILVIAAVGLGYIVFGQDNQHSVNGAQALTGALLNAKQRARRDGLPTGVRIIFTGGKDAAGNVLTDSNGNVNCLGSQLQLIQQPAEDYNTGQVATTGNNVTTVQFSGGADFQGGAKYIGQVDESTIQAGDYFIPASQPPTVHKILAVSYTNGSMGPQTPTLNLQSPVTVKVGDTYTIVRAPRRLPSEDAIQMPSGQVIDNSAVVGPNNPGRNYCSNIPIRTLTDSLPTSQPVAEIVFAPSGAVIGQGTQNDKIYLWLRDSSPKLAPVNGAPQVPGAPLILAVQIRTGLIGVYPVAPWPVGSSFTVNDPYAYVRSPRSSGL